MIKYLGRDGSSAARTVMAMQVVHQTPRELRLLPFQGSAAVRDGLVTRRQLRSAHWRRLFPDIYINAAISLDHRKWCEAAVLYVAANGHKDGIAISGISAAVLMGIELLPKDGVGPVELTVPPATRIRADGIIAVRSRLAAADLADFSRIPLTIPERTAFDLARRLQRLDAIAAVDAMLHRGITTIGKIRAYVLSAPSLPGRQRVFEIFALTDPLAESLMESRLRVTISDGGLPRPECQVEVRDANGQLIGRVDLAYRAERIAIEYEGDHHRERGTFRRDLARINALTAAGWIIIRVTADDIRNPDKMLQHIRGHLARSSA